MSGMDAPRTLPRQTRRFEQKREAILDAAAALFNEKGVRGATLQDVAQSVGLMTNSITYYYRKKEDLATACLLRTIEISRWARPLRVIRSAGGSPGRSSKARRRRNMAV